MCSRTISIINLKGGVGKSVTAINMAHILAYLHNKKVLIIDNDKQGNTSKFFGQHSYEQNSLTNVYINKNFSIAQCMYNTDYANIKIVPANMGLLAADRKILTDPTRPQQLILSKALQHLADEFDFIIIDNPPDLNMCSINAIAASTDVIIPLKLDQFALDGVTQLIEQIEELKDFNPNINLTGCLITQYTHTKASIEAESWLRDSKLYPLYKTTIRRTVKVDESTFSCRPLLLHSPKCTASKDYTDFVSEYLQRINCK